MVLAERYLRHLREKRLAEGRAQAQAETRIKLQAALEEARQNREDARVIAAYEKMLKAIDD